MTQALNLANFANTLNTAGKASNSGLQNPSVTVTAGTGLSGGGTVALGGSVSLANAGVTSIIAGSGISVSGATGNVTISNNAQGKILQILQAYKTDSWSASTAQGAYTTPPGLSISITPTLNTSKILIFANITLSSTIENVTVGAIITRNGTAIGSNTDQTRGGFTWGRVASNTDAIPQGVPSIYLDSPATTSTLTYAIQVANLSSGTYPVSVNYPYYNPDSTGGVSSITVMEVLP